MKILLFGFSIFLISIGFNGCGEITEASVPEYEGVYLQNKYGDFIELQDVNHRVDDTSNDYNYKYRILLNGYKPLGYDKDKYIKYDCLFKNEQLISKIIDIDKSDFKYIVNRGKSQKEYGGLKVLTEYKYPEVAKTHNKSISGNQSWLCGDSQLGVKTKFEGDTQMVKPNLEVNQGLYSIRYGGGFYVFRVN